MEITLDRFVGFNNVCFAEFAGVDLTGNFNEEFCCLVCIATGWRFEEFMGESLCQRRTFACGFGWASSFCSASNLSAALELVNDLRRRCPALSRQSA